MQMNLNTKHTMRLSISSINEYKQMLEQYKKKLPQVAENIVRRVSEVGLQDNHKSTELLPVKNEGSVVSGGIKTTDKIDTYREFGTGIVGSQNPHIEEYLKEVGWKYDVNEHGEKGWKYPKGDGTYGWTKGIPASKKFYNAIRKMEEELPNIAKEELSK